MFFLYGIVLTLASILLLPRFVFDAIFNGKYAAGFKQRLGFVPRLVPDGRKVVWLHCVSVGETNAARPLALKIKADFPDSRLIVSTTTRTGQELAKTAFADLAELVFYFPFDWKSTVRRSLKRLSPSIVLLMETEIWFNFIRETNHFGSVITIVNGRLSERSFRRYNYIKNFMHRILAYLDLALMQENADATRLMKLGIRAIKVKVTGNLKFDHNLDEQEASLTTEFRERFGSTSDAPLIIAASTHSPEEIYVLEAFKQVWKTSEAKLPRLMIAPRHPERFAEVAALIEKTGFSWARRSAPSSENDRTAEIILLDSIGELRAAYPLADIVFVGGSLIPHGGQSIYEPAAAGKAIITGSNTTNFTAAVTEFLEKDALIQLPKLSDKEILPKFVETLTVLLADEKRIAELGMNALTVMEHNRGAVNRTVEYLAPLLRPAEPQ
ncbi:MAG TPA: 3-deoxy-D-manno-octulosonic acid transferase [Pyrinomonadaceae bacterium]|nr:3-deoxy-D-manno-octulosonic acid transferase [Acidobacteriota bacterium]HQZ96383.1 3-deoxy-D-manno-octulosonic acid transferase [Pyrinomonadaceae bacterium]